MDPIHQFALYGVLLEMREKIEQSAQKIRQIKAELRGEQVKIRLLAADYETKRQELVKEGLKSRGLTWCTKCGEVLSENETSFVFLEGVRRYSCGYENSCYSYESFSALHRVCAGCRQKAEDEHGWKGDYDSTLKKQSCFYAFHVELRELGFWMRKFGVWEKLDGECSIPELDYKLVNRLAEEWNFPPEITIQDDKLLIHEAVAAAKAA
jgi:hypothetical protein